MRMTGTSSPVTKRDAFTLFCSTFPNRNEGGRNTSEYTEGIGALPMPIATRTFRVFVSSTFEDLKAERDALQRDAFSRLCKLREENNAR